MPLVRFELKNEYGLGDPRLYQGAPKKDEDPRNILGGVTVSGLVGILRQLGDLAEFAAVVFHDVHQQVTTTAARGHKVLNRIQKIEAALPRFEKAIQEQKNHIHFAYIAGCDWHANIKTGQSQFFGSDLPEFMMDSYEECRDPPPLHLLDKFDSAGSGACLKRYSDPSHFQRLMSSSESVMFEKAHNGMKVQRKKNQRSRGRNGLPYHSIHTTLHGRSLNSSVHCASLVTDELSFSVDDASISDSLSTSGFTNELIYFSSDKRSGCLELQNTPSSRSKEPYDVLSATEAETKQKVDCFFNNDNKVSASDYVIQDSFHQQNTLLSSSISSDEKIEMVKSVNQMLSHDIPEDGLKNPKTEELSSALSNRDHGTDGLGMQGECVSRSLTWDESATGNPETPGGVSSTYSAAWNEKAEIMESTSPKFPDDIIPCKPIDSDLLFKTLETSSQHSEMNDTEMLNQENGLLDTMKLVVQSSAGGQISELVSQLDKHMDTTDALGSKIQTNFEYHTEQGVILLPHLNYDGMECETNKILGVASPSFDGEIAHEAHTSLKKKFSSQVFDHVQSAGSAESAHRLHYSAENAVSEYLTSDSTMINDSERINNAPCSGVIIPSTQDVLIDGIPPEESLSRNSFRDSSAKAASEKEVLREHQTKQETESTAVSNYHGTEYQSSMNKVIAASKSDFLDSKTNVASFNSASCPGTIISSTQAVVIDGIPPEESLSQDSFGDTSAKTASEKEELCKHQTIREIQSTADSNCQGTEYQRTMEKLIAASKLDSPDSETHVASFNRATYTGAIIKQPVVIDVIPPEESLSQDSFGDTSANTAAEKDVLCEHQSKQETVSTAESNCQGTEYQSSMENVIAASKFDVLNYESHVASCGSSDDYASPILCGLIISNSVDTTSSSRISSDVTSSRSPIHILSPRSDSEDPGGNMSAPLSNTSEILLSDVTAATTVEFQGFDSFRKSSINIWTNGGLLGLEPSKPPDIIVPNVYDSDDIYDERSAANSQPRVLGHGNKSRKLFFEAEKLNHVVSFSEHDNIMGKISDEQSDSILSKQHLKDSIQASSFGGTALEIDRVRGKEGGNISSETNIYSKYEPESTVSRQNNSSFSVGFSSLAHRFLVNSLQRKSSMTGICPLSELMNNNAHKLHGTKIHSKDKARPKLAISSAPLHKLENKEDFAHKFSEKLVSPSLYSSGYQSPPLEDMKISFQPMNDSEASKLKLEFCSSQLQGNMGDMMFPSFQLLTESFQPLLDGVLESDDDTFCRSCPYSSDDLLSLHSESDAEIWGEDEIDFSHRIEVSVSISSSVEFNASNCCRVSQVNDVTNLKHGSDEPSFNSGDIIDHPNASFLEISQRQLHTCNPSMQHTDLLSLQPSSPFPPTQWRVMKPSFSYIENTISADVETDRSVGSLPTDRSASHQLQDQDEPES